MKTLVSIINVHVKHELNQALSRDFEP